MSTSKCELTEGCIGNRGHLSELCMVPRTPPPIPPEAERAMWMARDCLRSYLKYGDWDEQDRFGTQAAFDALTEVLIPDEKLPQQFPKEET